MFFYYNILDSDGRGEMMLYYTNTIDEIEILKYFEVHSSSVARPTTKTYKAAYTTPWPHGSQYLVKQKDK